MKNVALKYSKDTPFPRSNILDMSDYNSFTTKNKSLAGSRGWSEMRSNNGASSMSSSVRHDRYKLMGLDERGRASYFKNLKVIKKLQKEKK